MNLILLLADDFIAPDQVVLRGRRLKHVRDVHRAEVGQSLCVGRLDGEIGRGEVTHLDEAGLAMTVVWESAPPPPLPLTLLLALPRPKVLRRVFVTAASMGVKKIVLFNAYRVEKSYWQSPALTAEGIDESLHLGLEQGRDTVLPTVELRKRFRPFVEDELPALLHESRGLVAHPYADQFCPRALQEHVTLAIGPEGGFIPFEVELLTAMGMTPVACGERILRVEAAIPALLGRLF
ncbi:MAG: 16S rRNA (uracil(1498)-N(3))-methyltransferase [Desulfuromonas sp.]|nr:MAG: 16S rRNA (uracil(1498)-N(3))-methyltransferase [Desulfuromonas sp.]